MPDKPDNYLYYGDNLDILWRYVAPATQSKAAFA